MDSTLIIAVYMPLFIILVIILPQQHNMLDLAVQKLRMRKELMIMTNEVIKRYVGRKCKLSTGSFGTTVAGKIIEVNENWIEVETKNGIELINAEFVQSIKITQ